MEIANTFPAMVQLWQELDRTEHALRGAYKRFCPRAIIKRWCAEGILTHASDDTIWEICHRAEVEGYEELPSVQLSPRKHREFLRGVISVACNIGMRQVNVRALDAAFTRTFPRATPLNVSKKKREL